VALRQCRQAARLFMDYEEILVKKVARRNPFRLEHLPWITRVYRFPFNKWSSTGKQTLFGVFNFGLFFLYQRLVPVQPTGRFVLSFNGKQKRICFDGRNTQFEALYLSCWADGYEPELATLLDVLVPREGVFYDIGSNWGYLSVWVATSPGFKGKVHAFEPFPSTFKDLKSVVEQAGFQETIQVHSKALSDREGTTSMHNPDLLRSGWVKMDDEVPGASGGNIPTTSLDTCGLDIPSVIKIDAERAEAKILRGGRNLLVMHHPYIVFESFRDPSQPDATLESFRVLAEIGYEFFLPSWLRQSKSGNYLLSSDTPIPALPEEQLALVPFPPERRFLAPDLLNILACHRDDLPRLKQIFEPRRV
jgi:FkbM family methyltransferase